jgi:hypothetical protein
MMFFRTLTVILGGTAIASTAFGADAYSDFSAGNTFDNLSGWVVGSYVPAFQFQSTLSGSLTGFEVAMGDYEISGDQPYTVNLYADPGGSTSGEGALLGSWTGTTDGAYYYGMTSADVDSISAGGVSLVAGDYYWFEVSDGPTYGNLALDWSNYATGPMLENDSPYGTTDTDGAFSVQATASTTPSPAALVPFALGLIGVVRRKKQS